MNEVKLSLSQLLSLYTGGRPVGNSNYSSQYDKFIDNYENLVYVDFKHNENHIEKLEKINYRNVIASIENQYPSLKKIKSLCGFYIKKIPALYDANADEKIINTKEYKELSKKLITEARKVIGKDKVFIVKKALSFGK